MAYEAPSGHRRRRLVLHPRPCDRGLSLFLGRCYLEFRSSKGGENIVEKPRFIGWVIFAGCLAAFAAMMVFLLPEGSKFVVCGAAIVGVFFLGAALRDVHPKKRLGRKEVAIGMVADSLAIVAVVSSLALGPVPGLIWLVASIGVFTCGLFKSYHSA